MSREFQSLWASLLFKHVLPRNHADRRRSEEALRRAIMVGLNPRSSAKIRGRYVLALARGPAQLAAAEQVQVQMEDGLSRAGAYVVDRAIAVFNAAFARDLCRDDLAVSQQLGV